MGLEVMIVEGVTRAVISGVGETVSRGGVFTYMSMVSLKKQNW